MPARSAARAEELAHASKSCMHTLVWVLRCGIDGVPEAWVREGGACVGLGRGMRCRSWVREGGRGRALQVVVALFFSLEVFVILFLVRSSQRVLFLASAGIAWGGGPLQAFGVGGALACMGWGAGGAWAGNFTYLWGWGLFFRVGGSCGVCSATGGLRPL